MSKRATHTHRGHCQACGAVQAIETGREPYMPRAPLAKHGYKVTWGFFSGVCNGSGKPALQYDRTHCDEICKELLRYAISMDARARKLKARDGMLAPDRLVTGSEPNPDYALPTATRKTPRFRNVYAAWCDCTTPQRDAWFTSAQHEAERQADSARRHRTFLRELADKVLGTEPLPVDAKPRAIAPGDVFTLHGREWRVRELRSGRGMGGRSTYVECERTDGQTVTPKQYKAAVAERRSIAAEFRPAMFHTRAVRAALGSK